MTQATAALLARFISKHLAPELKEGALAPRDYVGDLQSWAESQAVARRKAITDLTVLFHQKISAGWSEPEILSESGEVIEVSGDGQPRRRLRSTVSALAMAEAELVWRQLHSRGLHVEGAFEQALEAAAARSFSGSPEILAEAVRAASAVCDSYHRDAQRKQGEAATIAMRVVCGFTHPRTRHEYGLGIHMLGPRQAIEIILWKARMQASFGGRASGPSESGYSIWPPCVIERESELIEQASQPSMWAAQ